MAGASVPVWWIQLNLGHPGSILLESVYENLFTVSLSCGSVNLNALNHQRRRYPGRRKVA